MASEFEEKYFQQPNYWVGGLKFDVMKSELVLSLISDPVSGEIEGEITFCKITEYSGEFFLDDYDPDCIECLIGIHTEENENLTTYCINFGIGEVLFKTPEGPSVKWRDPEKCRIYLLHKERIKT